MEVIKYSCRGFHDLKSLYHVFFGKVVTCKTDPGIEYEELRTNTNEIPNSQPRVSRDKLNKIKTL